MKIITAMGDPYINNKLKEKYEVIGKDIFYQEGILEILTERKDIDLLVLSNNLPFEYKFEELIEKIIKEKEELEIIVFLKEKDENIENYLNSKNIYKIFYLNEEGYRNFFNVINSKENNPQKIQDEIKNFKEIILNNSKKKGINLKSDFLKNKIEKEEKNKQNSKKDEKENERNFKNREEGEQDFENREENKSSKIIVVSGNSGAGKTIVSILLSKYIEKQNKKVLLIDFDLKNKSINTLLGVKKKKNTEENISIFNKNLYILNEAKEILNSFETYKINMFLEELKNKFDYIIIDFSNEINEELGKSVLLKANKIIFLLESNLLEIKKAKNFLEIYLEDYGIDSNKIKIVFNKANKYKIPDFILKEIFSNFEIIGNIEYDEKYTLFINKNFNNINCKDEYKKIYEKL